MFKKTLTAAVTALTLATAVTPAPAQAGSLGKVVAVGILGAAVGAIAGAAGSKAARAEDYDRRDDRRGYDRSGDGYREAGYTSGRRGYGGDCGVESRPVFDRSGEQVGWRRVPAC
jgi:hypothetical protein